jgi:hypothetical protein
MSSEQQDFEGLRRLLAVKRHEQPPPGYFQDFSRQVIARIRAEEAEADVSLWSRVARRMPWLGGFWSGFEAKPILAGAFGVGVCGLLVFGLVSSERIDASLDSLAAKPTTQQTFFARVPDQIVGTSLFERASADTGVVTRAQSPYSIFDEIQKPRVQPVNFSVSAPAN